MVLNESNHSKNSFSMQLTSLVSSRSSACWSKALAVFFFAAWSAMSVAETDKTDLFYWLARSNTAARTQNYHGIVHYYRYGETSHPVTIIHLADNGVGQTVMVTKDQGSRQLSWDQRESKASIYAMDGNSRLIKMPRIMSLQSLTPAQTQSLSNYYTVKPLGGEQVINRSADRVLISAKNHDRYSYKAWVDNKTGVLLRGELLDESGQVIEGFAFNQIIFGNSAKEKAASVTKGLDKPAHTLKAATKHNSSASIWRFAYLPDGFINTVQLRREIGPKAVEQWLFSDGINTFSLFFRPLDEGEVSAKNIDVGRFSPSNVIVRHISGYEVVLVGHMPFNTLTKIMDNIQSAHKQ